MSLVSINDVLKITTKVEKIHPYKVIGDRDSYSPYNEGWSDCIRLIEHYLEQIPFVEQERVAKVLKHKYRLSISLNVVGESTVFGYEWICENCKKKVIDGEDYCSHCGSKLDWSENE